MPEPNNLYANTDSQAPRELNVLRAEVTFACSAARAYLKHFQKSLRLDLRTSGLCLCRARVCHDLALAAARQVKAIQLPINTENKMLQGSIKLQVRCCAACSPACVDGDENKNMSWRWIIVS